MKQKRFATLLLAGSIAAGFVITPPMTNLSMAAASGGPKFMGNILSRAKNSKTMDDNTKGLLDDIATWGFLVVALSILVTGVGGLILNDRGHEGAAGIAFKIAAGIMILAAVSLGFDSWVPTSAVPGYPVAIMREAFAAYGRA
jgi:hypothetical protein